MKIGLEYLYILQKEDDKIKEIENTIKEIPENINKLEIERDDKAKIIEKAKKKLKEVGSGNLYRFFIETCRAETTHWMLIGVAPLFFLWNRLWVGVFMIVYAVAQNLPLIMIQRYNRIRFRRILAQRNFTG